MPLHLKMKLKITLKCTHINKSLLNISALILLTIVIYLLGYHKTAIILFIIVGLANYFTGDFYLDTVRTRVE